MSWRSRRFARQEAEMDRLIDALRAHPDAPALRLARCAGISPAKVYVYLAQLEEQDAVSATWADGPYPRRRLYRLSGSAL